MLGTIFNVLTVVIGSIVGLTIKSKIPVRVNKMFFTCIGLFTLLLGLKMAFKSQQMLVLLFTIILGALAGELLDIDKQLNCLGDFIQQKLKSKNTTFTEGLVTAFLLFCIGPLTILGCLEEGLGGYPNQLVTKSIMDGFSSIALASALGNGVLFSAVPLFIFQALITFFAGWLQPFLTDVMITELTATGGLMIVALALNILEIKHIKVANLLPALLLSPFLVQVSNFVSGYIF